mmetsp:Transcript_3291/g.5977  ORF Transcript_3291/g.5977 Transcript_3291/m.5977 type:complete len:95 (-) Transcript_3291:1248-1532(-)
MAVLVHVSDWLCEKLVESGMRLTDHRNIDLRFVFAVATTTVVDTAVVADMVEVTTMDMVAVAAADLEAMIGINCILPIRLFPQLRYKECNIYSV